MLLYIMLPLCYFYYISILYYIIILYSYLVIIRSGGGLWCCILMRPPPPPCRAVEDHNTEESVTFEGDFTNRVNAMQDTLKQLKVQHSNALDTLSSEHGALLLAGNPWLVGALLLAGDPRGYVVAR